MSGSLSLKHISSITFNLPHLAQSSGVRSARLLLAGIPSSPSQKNPTVPEVVVKTVTGPSSIELTYSNKQRMKVDIDQPIKFEDLLRKVGAPARALKLADSNS
ncbi:unnamed protein product [Sympodiomycopsis kandeliae]